MLGIDIFNESHIVIVIKNRFQKTGNVGMTT